MNNIALNWNWTIVSLLESGLILATVKPDSRRDTIDETARRIYLAYKGHLLHLPLASDQKSSGK